MSAVQNMTNGTVAVNNSYINVNLDAATWGWLQISFWIVAAIIIMFLVFVVYHFVQEHRTPLVSKKLRDAHRSHKSSLLLAGDDGIADVTPVNYTGSEGWGETKESGKPKWNYVGFFPRPGQVSPAIPVADENGKDLSRTRTLASYINFLNTRKIFPRGSNSSLWVGVKSKAILANILAIAGVQITEEVEKALSGISQVFLIDVSAMKRMVVSSSYNASQVIALTKIHEQIGFEKRGDAERLSKMVVFLGIGLCILGAVMLGIAGLL